MQGLPGARTHGRRPLILPAGRAVRQVQFFPKRGRRPTFELLHWQEHDAKGGWGPVREGDIKC